MGPVSELQGENFLTNSVGDLREVNLFNIIHD